MSGKIFFYDLPLKSCTTFSTLSLENRLFTHVLYIKWLQESNLLLIYLPIFTCKYTCQKNVSGHIVQLWPNFQFLFYRQYGLVFLQQHRTQHLKNSQGIFLNELSCFIKRGSESVLLRIVKKTSNSTLNSSFRLK